MVGIQYISAKSFDCFISDSIKQSNDSLSINKIDSISSDTISTDSVKKSKSTLDFPITYSAKDSMSYIAATGMTNLYGNSNVSYLDMNLESAVISMNMDSSIVYAHGVKDSTGVWQETPIYKQGSDEYDSESMSYNFKTRKGYIQNVYTAQGDGFMKGEESKRSSDGTLFLRHGKYTTCDDPHPHFYLSLSRAKVKPGKEAIFGPAYLVVEDVPLPLAIPFGFFPFNKKYSSGFVMPTYGTDTEKGFYLRDGGYYFAINDKMDLYLLGEIYTKGSWGINASSTYKKRYRYSGNFYVNYLNAIEGEKNMPDYQKTTSFKIQWSHRQDSKALPNSSLSASVNFATQSFEKSNLSSIYDPMAYTQSTRTSSISYSKTFPGIGLTLSTTANLSQNMRDSTISVSFPELNISLSRIYPFKKKKAAGKQQWYEKIALTYTGQLSNSISTKESKLMSSNLIKDWRNGMNHSIPISANFSLLKYINVSPSFNFRDRMYSNKIMQSWDNTNQMVLNDTIYGFYNVYDWNAAISANTTLYGFYVPNPKIFGKKIMAVRHVFKPSVSYSFSPDFGTSSYGYYDSYVKTDAEGNVSTVTYSPYSNGMFGVPSKGKSGNISMSISNNVEMKIRSERDSTGEKKISIIDELSATMSYNTAAKIKPWSDLNTRLRLKLSKNYTFSLAAVFATYAYEFDKNGNVILGNTTEYSHGRFGRFQGMSQNFSYTFNNNTFKKKNKEEKKEESFNEDIEYDEDKNTNMDPELTESGESKTSESETSVSEDGYLKFSIPWSFTISYGVTMRENTSGHFNANTMRYPYKLTHTMNFSGNISLSQGWNINFTSGYDFNFKQLSMTTASLSRDLHCFSMTCSVVLRPYTSYNFSFRAKMSTLADLLKWDKRSSYSSNIEWY